METFTSDQGTKYDIVWYGTVSETIGETDGLAGNHVNIPIYILQKSSQSCEVKEESPATTESEKKDFGKKLIDFLYEHDLYQTMTEFEINKLNTLLSSNGYL